MGTLVGLAVGDALGTAVEFMSRGSFSPVTDMRGGGVFQLRPGEWTDDTSMAIALAEALSKDRSLADPGFAMNRWVNWYRHGDYSHIGTCFDIGRQTSLALDMWADYQRLPEQDAERAGNGGIMRLSPAVVAKLHDQVAAVDVAQRQSDLTHQNHLYRKTAGQLSEILFRLRLGRADRS